MWSVSSPHPQKRKGKFGGWPASLLKDMTWKWECHLGCKSVIGLFLSARKARKCNLYVGSQQNQLQRRWGQWTVVAAPAIEDDCMFDCPEAFLPDRIGFSDSLLKL